MNGEGESSDDEKVRRLERRVERERAARHEAEKLLEQKSTELYHANQKLIALAEGLEQRVVERTQELVTARENAVRLAERDQLTGLANRMCFTRLLTEAIEGWSVGNHRFALLFIDLDRFKEINDTVGHDAGDAVLQHAAAMIKKAIRGHDIVARLGGDEFAVICNFIESPRDVERVAERIMVEFQNALGFRGRTLPVACSIGSAVVPDDACNMIDLQRFADIALYRSKASGRSVHTPFSATMNEEIHQRQTLENALRLALRNGDIEPWYQPIRSVSAGDTVAAEVLARWRKADGSIATPDKFIRVLEECGLMRELFVSVLSASCRAARPWVEQQRLQYLSVNVSPGQFKLGSLLDDVTDILECTGFPHNALQLEITEEALIYDLHAVSSQLEELKQRGVRIALDDFGSGYSSIGYLRRLPIHTLKLDRSLISDVATDVRARAIVSAIGEIAKAIGVELVAEGVETEAQALWLGRAGCDLLQGYLFGRPVSRATFEEGLLRSQPEHLTA
ncbi:MAG: bifunctional diguanylate cyclase/phosphodiesterase [Hyphomicrobium sp.]|jgi:diguanylate cyclase (GGDEF)-like protein|uniref:putative bifunctional diguanylate cyclase/phosphodiesterase n=1 Tax=Hyphomicrobium sp. TaxID=82 RepID=UPI0025BF1746|nr:bifunctional diguanylate cyclase/phosphodiesterase [Hyphomicrobium sp.]MBX9862041.1 bifunctional diguanylate cyclase/phosphodiesterase [Hyphomicrobium sp.]